MPTTESPAPKPRNPNRDLAATEVVALFRQRLPKSMLAGLCADREWLWWAGEKPDEPTREILGEIGFDFTPREHAVTLRGGSSAVAHWFHSCGGHVKRGRGGGRRSAPEAGAKPATTPARRREITRPAAGGSRPVPAPAVAPESDAASLRFLRFAEQIA